MKAWIWTFIVFVAAVGLALVLGEHNGNVLIVAPPWHVSFSLTFAALGVIFLFFIMYVLLRVVSWLTGSPERFKIWRRHRAQQRDQSLLQNGWVSVLEGRYPQAEKELSKLLNKTRSKSTKVVAGLASAQAAQYLGENQRRDESLRIARQNAGDSARLKQAYATAAAELHLEQNQPQAAIELLRPLQNANSRNFHAIRLLLRAYKQKGDYERVYELTRTLLRRSAIDKNEALAYIEYSAAKRLEVAGIDQFKSIWSDLRTEERNSVQVALAAAQLLADHANHDEAAKILESAIQQHMAPELLSAYARSPENGYKRRLSKAEGWLKSHPDDPALLATLGRLCIIGQIWGQAEQYLQRSMSIRNDLRVHALLGQLYDVLGQPEKAVYHWRIAAVTAGSLPIMPPNRLLPVADFKSDPTIVDGHLLELEVEPEHSTATEAALPVAASAVDETVFKKNT